MTRSLVDELRAKLEHAEAQYRIHARGVGMGELMRWAGRAEAFEEALTLIAGTGWKGDGHE